MSGPNLTTHVPAIPLKTVSGNTELTLSVNEKSGQTFLAGVPVQLASGVVQKWDGTTIAAGIFGISLIMGSNLASNGKGAPPQPWGQIGPPGAIQTWGSVPNQPNGVNIAIGTPFSDGRTLLAVSYGDTIFEAMCDNSAGSVAADYTPTQASIGTQYGLTFDTNGYIYVDLGKTTPGTNTVVQCVGINPDDGLIVNARLQFVFIKSAQQMWV